MRAQEEPEKPREDLTDKVFRVGGELAYIVLLSVVWIVMSIPVITLPAATVGVHATLVSHIADGNREYLRPFWQGFRTSFRGTTLPGLLLVFLTGLCAFNAYFYAHARSTTGLSVTLAVAQAALASALMLITTYYFALRGAFSARDESDGWPGIRTAGSTARHHWAASLAVLAISLGVPTMMVWLGLWQFSLFLMGTLAYFNVRVLNRAKVWE
ncbi:YesL family protein [Acidipropionibacterium jensenii]|uniref:YesL family protein n=1 Tax=Acidipropionibacterium jensenii TaxID=1749 RepID=UPI00214C526C|nr:YesL family protein [Acidipropionibacterium jensenii]